MSDEKKIRKTLLFICFSLSLFIFIPSVSAMSPTELYQAKHLGKNRVEFLLDHMNSETNKEASAQL